MFAVADVITSYSIHYTKLYDYLMVQELVRGQTLAFMQELLVKAGAAMPPEAACYIVFCLLKALDYIHRAKVGENGATIDADWGKIAMEIHEQWNP